MDKNLAKLLSRLSALKANIPQRGWGVSKKYVDEFNLILEELRKITDEELNEFKVPDNEVRPRMTSVSYGGHKTYTDEHFCDREFILMKIDGILGYFTLLLEPIEVKNKLGFDVENND